MQHYHISVIQEKPINIILHDRKNDAKNLPLQTILDKLLKIKALERQFIHMQIFYINSTTLCTDNVKTQMMVSQPTKRLLQLKIDTVNNHNINDINVGGKGLHLNQSGLKLLSRNSLKNFELSLNTFLDLKLPLQI